MARGNQLIVEVVGDTTKLEAAMKRTEQATTRLGNRAAAVGAGFVIGQIARNATRDMAQLGGEVGRLGRSFNSLLSLDVVGFFRGVRSETGPTVEQLVKTGEATKLLALSNKLAGTSFQNLAKDAKAAAEAIQKAEEAARTVIPFAQIANGTFGITPLDHTKPVGAGRRGITAGQRNRFFDDAVASALFRAQGLSPNAQVSEIGRIQQQVRDRLAATKDPTRRRNLENQIIELGREQEALQDAIAADLKAQREALAEGRRRAAEAMRRRIAELKSQADQIKSAVLERFDRETTKIDTRRALEDARKALRLARGIGGPEGIRFAQRGLVDAQRAAERFRLSQLPISVTEGAAGARNNLSFAGVTIVINSNQSPEQIAKQVESILLKRAKKSSGSQRGRRPGTNPIGL